MQHIYGNMHGDIQAAQALSAPPQVVFADNYLPLAHNQSMNKEQRRGQLLSGISPDRTCQESTPYPPSIFFHSPKTLQIISKFLGINACRNLSTPYSPTS